VFRIGAGLGVLGLAAAALAFVAGVRAVAIGPQHGHTLAGAFTYPTVSWRAALVLPLAALGVASLGLAAVTAWRHLRAARRLGARLEQAERIEGEAAVRVIPVEQPTAFCAGFLRPRVYVSSGALRVLEAPELEAVLAHENHHRSQRDPLRLALAGVLARALFFLPVVEQLLERHASLIELAADQAAIATDGGRAALARALLKLAPPDELGGVGIDPERVDHLAGNPPRLALPLLGLAAGVLTIGALLGVALAPGPQAELHASLGLPLLSKQPCVLALAGVPGLLAGGAALLFRRG
jgi:BlaR1 peptidase M56